tara:strand:+ start:2151 stop:2549 length:399 start_codon:yes stop_codon:yes gene_type:complete
LTELNFERLISKRYLKVINKLLKELTLEKIDEKEVNAIDGFRNMIFRDGIMTDNNCLINVAYDLDILLDNIDKNHDLGMIEEITEIFDHMIESNSWKCIANHCNVTYSLDEKTNWNNHFKLNGFYTKSMGLN